MQIHHQNFLHQQKIYLTARFLNMKAAKLRKVMTAVQKRKIVIILRPIVGRHLYLLHLQKEKFKALSQYHPRLILHENQSKCTKTILQAFLFQKDQTDNLKWSIKILLNPKSHLKISKIQRLKFKCKIMGQSLKVYKRQFSRTRVAWQNKV